MKIEEPDSPAKMDETTVHARSRDAWWKQWLGHFAIRLTLLVVVVTAMIWLVIHEANKQDHSLPTLFQKLQELFH